MEGGTTIKSCTQPCVTTISPALHPPQFNKYFIFLNLTIPPLFDVLNVEMMINCKIFAPHTPSLYPSYQKFPS